MAKSAESILRVSGLTRSYGSTKIIDNFNLQVRSGEAIALTGRNGAGKSTLLRCLVGADKPTEGEITICGEKLAETSRTIRKNLATVIDDIDFFPDLSVVEHLDLLARAHGLADPETVVDDILHEVQLVPQAGQLPGTLSSGQRRRLALATAFVRPRKLLVLDEPEQRLDTEGVRWLADRLNSELADGLALVFASHEPYLVEQVATRVVRLGPERSPEDDDAEAATDATPVSGPADWESYQPKVPTQSQAPAQPKKQPQPQQSQQRKRPKPSHGKKRR